MKRLIISSLAAALLSACGNMNDFPELEPITHNPSKPIVDDPGTIDDNLSGDLSTKDFRSFTIAMDESALSEPAEIIPTLLTDPTYEDFVENMYDAEDEQYTVEIRYDGDKVFIDDTYYASGTYTKIVQKKDTFIIDGAHITVHANKKYQYILSGNSDNGSLTLYQNKKCSITLDGLSLANKSGAPINLQSGKRAYIILKGDDNKLSDCNKEEYTKKTSPDDGTEEDEKGVIFSEGKLAFSGNGKLTINAKGKNGIASDDYIFTHVGSRITINTAPDGDGIKTNDGMYLFGGVLNINANGYGNKGLNSEGVIDIRGGRTTIVNTASSTAPLASATVQQPTGIKTDTELRITGGELFITATDAEARAIRAKQSYYQAGGTVKVLSAIYVGDTMEDHTIAGNATMAGGRLAIRNEQGDGFVCENTTRIIGGVIESQCQGKAIGAKSITMDGGYVFANALTTESLTINGGVCYIPDADGTASAITSLTLNGGTMAYVGRNVIIPSAESKATVFSGSVSATKGTLISLCSSDGTCHAALQIPYDYTETAARLLITAPKLTSNSHLCHGGKLSLTSDGMALQGIFANGITLTGQETVD